jgi:transcriptional regulator with XRE-family HTH domain
VDTIQMIGIRIAEIRKQKGLTQEVLADKMGVSPKYLSSIERGKENPTLNMLVNLADSLEVDLGQIFTFIQIEDPKKRKALLESLLKKADDEQLKMAIKIMKAVVGN